MYSVREVARAAGVPEARVHVALGDGIEFLSHRDAVELGRRLVAEQQTTRSIFSPFATPLSRRSGLPFALSSTVHAGAVAAIAVVFTFAPAPIATTLSSAAPDDPMRLVFVDTPGPGGGGGGGGRLEPAPPPKAMREGHKKLASPVPVPPRVMEPVAKPPEPKPTPLSAESLPVVVAPIAAVPADIRDRAGVLAQARSEIESRGPGAGGGVGTGRGSGIGEGDGAGVGPGSGGGTGGGPYRPGSGITPPRVLQEVKAEYTDEARRSGITGDVVLEIVVRRDGSVGDAKLLHGLGGGLNERARQAVKQWRFAPATRQGVAVDVIVEVAVEFRLR